MNQATLYDFESEKIKIDYLTFNIKNTEHNLQKIGIKSKNHILVLQILRICVKWYSYFTLIQQIEILF